MNLRNFTAALLLMLAGLFTITSCGKDDEKIRTQIENNITEGTWRITNFDDSGVDKKDNFDGFTFIFTEAGLLTATNGIITQAGTWSITDGDEDDDILDDLDFNINFTAPLPEFEDLNDDWDIESQSVDKLNLIEVGGITDTDLLTFQKN